MGRMSLKERRLSKKLKELSKLFDELLMQYKSESLYGLKVCKQHFPEFDPDAGFELIESTINEYIQQHDQIIKSKGD